MLQNLDTVIAFSVIMLLLSLVITTVVQIVVSILGLRGKQLKWGLKMLFRQAATEPTEKKAAAFVARQVLAHPVLAPTRIWFLVGLNWLVRPLNWVLQRFDVRLPTFNAQRLPTAITLEDIELVLDSLKENLDDSEKLEQLVAKLPAEVGTRVTGLVQNTEEQKERLSKWFETTMDATTERFKLRTRWITAVGAVLLAFGYQIDSGEILQQLNESPEIRAQLVAQATQVEDLYRNEREKPASDDAQQDLTELKSTLDKLNKSINDSRLEVFHPIPRWNEVSAECEQIADSKDATLLQGLGCLLRLNQRRVLLWDRVKSPTSGAAITALLLSLGAPFWYGVLSNLIGFRSIVARKQDPEQKKKANR